MNASKKSIPTTTNKTLPINWYGQKLVQGVALSMLVVFLLSSLLMVFTVAQDCGCFGTLWRLPPWISVIKNTVLIAVIMVVFNSEPGMQEYA